MSKRYLKLSKEERAFIKKMSVISGESEAVIKNIFLSMLMAFTIEYFDADVDYNLCIPYIANLKVDTENMATKKGLVKIVSILATASNTLKAEIKAIHNGEETPTEKMIKQKIKNRFESLITDTNIDEVYEVGKGV